MSKKFIEAIGRRKRSRARVRLYDSKGETTVNDKPIGVYFPSTYMVEQIIKPLAVTDNEGMYMTIRVEGGGTTGQWEAIRHGISRTLVEKDEGNRTLLKKEGFLKRDPRKKERKKPGLKKARKAAQWSKR